MKSGTAEFHPHECGMNGTLHRRVGLRGRSHFLLTQKESESRSDSNRVLKLLSLKLTVRIEQRISMAANKGYY